MNRPSIQWRLAAGFQPPQASQKSHSRTMWGRTVVDNWAWLSDGDDPAVVDHLRAENRYFDEVMAPLEPLRREIYGEIKSRVVETDLSVPVQVDDWLYSWRTEEGKSYPIHCRRPAPPSSDQALAGSDDPGQPPADEQILLDENLEANNAEYFDVGPVAVSQDHRWLLWGWDDTGDERYSARIRDLATGIDIDDHLEGLAGSVAWFADNQTVLYTTADETNRPYRVWRHQIGKPQSSDELVFEEPDKRFFVGVGLEKDRSFIQIGASSKITDEIWIIAAHQPQGIPRLIAQRQEGVEYSVVHRHDQFIILTNRDQATNFKVMTAPDNEPGPDQWVDLDIEPDVQSRHPESVTISDIDVTDSHLILYERADGLSRIRLRRFADGSITEVDQPETPSTLWAGLNVDMKATALRYGYSSLVSPAAVMSHQMDTGVSTILKRQPVLGGFDPTLYHTRRDWVKASDGTEIPISLVWRRDRPVEPGPCLLYAYGAYEVSVDPMFSVSRLSLLDRGFVFAIAHVRGGGEMGRGWYTQGKLEHKPNTFGDLLCAARHLIDQGLSEPDQLVVRGASAGGLAVGAVINLNPELFAGAVAQVPFVDVVNTMLDEDLPLTVTEWEEWGNPAESQVTYETIASYAPYEQVGSRPYPKVLATGGLNDTRVGFWEPAKWVQALRHHSTSGQPVLLHTEMGAGHGGPSGRYAAWDEEARILSFVVACVSE